VLENQEAGNDATDFELVQKLHGSLWQGRTTTSGNIPSINKRISIIRLVLLGKNSTTSVSVPLMTPKNLVRDAVQQDTDSEHKT
jgi:hypothetical protein